MKGTANNHRARLLLIEDDLRLGKVVARMLTREYEVVVATEAQEALEQQREDEFVGPPRPRRRSGLTPTIARGSSRQACDSGFARPPTRTWTA